MGLTDQELVDQIKEDLYLQLFTGLEAFEYWPPFDIDSGRRFRKYTIIGSPADAGAHRESLLLSLSSAW